MSKSMYIHVPFCDSICAYCDFERCKRIPLLSQKWLKRMIKDIEERKDEIIDTLYIGGGTPTSLSCDELDELLSSLDGFHPNEYTIEANIENLTREKIMILLKHGINRISLGVQSLNDDLIKIINRHHTSNDIFKKIDEIYDAGITNISVDMIYGLPSQTLDIWLEDLSKIASYLKVSHVSIYSLTIEEHSKFGRENVQKVSEELDEEMYFQAIACLEKHGFIQYEISNFARNHKESLHNTTYWEYEDFIGLGCGAYGKENSIYYHHPFRINEYVDGTLITHKDELEKEDEMFECVMMGLRMKKGISISKFMDRFHEDIFDYYKNAIDKHVRLGNLIVEENYLKCSENGFGLLNSILVDFME